MKVFFFICSISLVQFSSSTTLEETCNEAANSDFSFCVTSLQAVPESRAVDTKGLAVIATNLTIANYTHNLAKTRELLNGGGLRDRVKRALGSCSAAYDVGVSDLNLASVKIESDETDAALVRLSEAWKRPAECEDAFKEHEESSLMRREDDFASRLITIALKITVYTRQDVNFDTVIEAQWDSLCAKRCK